MIRIKKCTSSKSAYGYHDMSAVIVARFSNIENIEMLRLKTCTSSKSAHGCDMSAAIVARFSTHAFQ